MLNVIKLLLFFEKAMTIYLLINNIWPEYAELLATRPITIHEFHATRTDCLNKTFFGLILNV